MSMERSETNRAGEDCLDLGPLDGPVIAFGGPLGNLQAIEALLAAAKTLAVPPERMVCTGDTVAYCGDPAATVGVLRAAGVAVVMGNVEESLAAESDDCGCGFAEGTACDALSGRWYAHCRAEIDAEARRWMATLPRAIRFTLGGRRLLAVHGAPSRINRYVFPSTPEAEIAAEITLAAERTGAEGVITGHSGIPFARVVGERLWLNAGTVGLPANDGTARNWFALLRPEARGIAVEIRALDYDHDAAAAAMRRHGLPAVYAEALESGLWPSLDVLPPAERAATGAALAPERLLWPASRRA